MPHLSRSHCVFLSLSLLLVISFFASLGLGAVSIDISSLFTVFGNKLKLTFGLVSEKSHMPENYGQLEIILFHLRIPRACLAIFVGALLALSGAITQGLFRNPLADPSLIGVTAGASVGASVAIVMGDSLGFSATIGTFGGLSFLSLAACMGACCAVLAVYFVTSKATRSMSGGTASGLSVTMMLLVGIGMTALAGAFTSILEFFADNMMLRRMSMWRMGGLEGANVYQLAWAFGICCVLIGLVPRYSKALNAMLLGDSEARALGVAVHTIKWQLVLIVAVAVGCAVTLAGTIAFVGLVVPHIMRLVLGPNHTILLPSSALAGALLLLLADTFSRTVMSPVELPVGLVTTLVGAPIFLMLLAKGRPSI